MPSELMEIYTDDSGVGRSNGDCFIMGMWLTWRPLLWRKIIRDLRTEHKYHCQLHFHKMGSNWQDRRYKILYGLLQELARHSRTWYYRGFYVGPEHYPLWQVEHPDTQAMYDWALRTSASRFIAGVPEASVRLVAEQRNRPAGDLFVPHGLQGLLQTRFAHWGKVIAVDIQRPAQDDLLQVADFFTAAVRHKYHPSGNKCKFRFADALDWYEPIADRVRVWQYGR